MPNTSITKADLATAGILLFFFGFCAFLILSCYKGDPGYGNTDYPPSPDSLSKDSGADAAKGKTP
jgi:hypothetical protein